MINYSQRENFYKDSVHKDWRIVCTRDNETIATITNTELREESITITESLDSSEDLIFGRCEPSKFEFEVHNVIEKLKGCTVTVDLIMNHDESNPFRVGTYYVDSDKPTANRDFRNVVCYDFAGKLGELELREWYDSLTFPMTLKKFRNAFFTHVGITQKSVNLINDSVKIYKGLDNSDSSRNVTNESLSAMNVLNAICELNGCFGHINRQNQFVYTYLPKIIKGLYPADDLFPEDTLYPSEDVVNGTFYPKYYKSCEYEDFETKLIDGVIVYSDNSDQVVKVNENATNPYLLENNFLLYKMNNTELTTVATNMLSKIEFIFYSPCSIECVADLCMEVGDSYVFNDKYNQVYSYVMTRTMKGLQVMEDTLESRGNEDRTKNLNNLNSKLNRVANKQEYDAGSSRSSITETNNHIDEVEEETYTMIQADRADITALYAADVVISGNLDAASAHIGRVEADLGSFETLTTRNFSATNASIDSLEANVASFKTLTASNFSADRGRIGTLEGDVVSINGDISSINGDISTINGSIRTINGDISSIEGDISSINGSIRTINGDISTANGNISAVNGRVDAAAASISQLNTEITNTNSLFANYATIEALNAHTISADKITAGTISADRLDGSVIAAKLAGNSIYCGFISAGSADIGGYAKKTYVDDAIAAVKSWASGQFEPKS